LGETDPQVRWIGFRVLNLNGLPRPAAVARLASGRHGAATRAAHDDREFVVLMHCKYLRARPEWQRHCRAAE
jgi:hypothetical protein